MSKPRTTITPRKLDNTQIGTILASTLALIISCWAASETRQTRLDAKRLQLRGEALALVRDANLAVNTYNCYALVKGADLKGQDAFMSTFRTNVQHVRDDIQNIADASQSDLITIEKVLNTFNGELQNTMNERLIIDRNSWDKGLRERVDSVCKTW